MELTTRLSTEVIQRAAIVVLFNHLNNMIQSMGSTWANEDDEYWQSLSRGNQDWFVEKIANENFYAGNIPSLINASIDRYPNVSAICYSATPPNSLDDEGELYNVLLTIEVMVKSTSEEEINSRIQKTLDAIHLTFMDTRENRTLNNTIPMLNAPKQSIGDVFIGRERERDRTRKERTHTNEKWFWQGGSLEYVVNKFVDFY
jgi:hypothetical protein